MNKKVITLGIIGIMFLGLTLHGAHAQYSENSSGKGYESKERKLKAYGKKRGKGSMHKRKGCLNKEQRGEQKALKQEYKQEIEDFKSENSELIYTYKNEFDATYGSTLDTLNNNQLQKIHFQLKGISRKISENSELSQEELQESKIKIIAFAELIKSYMNSEESNLDIESILGIQ